MQVTTVYPTSAEVTTWATYGSSSSAVVYTSTAVVTSVYASSSSAPSPVAPATTAPAVTEATEGQPEQPTSAPIATYTSSAVAPATFTGAAAANHKPAVALLGGVVALLALA